MLIKATRIRTSSGAGPLLRHLGNAEDNEEVIAVQGTEQDVRDAVADAKRFGRTYSLRHWIIAPEIAIENDQFRDSAQAIADEFGFDIKVAFIVEHQKARAIDGVADRHWHVVVPEVDPVSGRVLDTRNDFSRHEKIARILEVAFDHPITAGRHDKAVIAALRAEGRHDVADRIAASSTVPNRPAEAFTTIQHQQAKREGLDLALLKGHIAQAWGATNTGHAFAARLARHGLSIAPGDKQGIWVIRARDGTFIGAGHRLARVQRAAFNHRMESIDERPATVYRPVDPQEHRRHQSPDGDNHGAGPHDDEANGRRTGFVPRHGSEAVGHDRDRRGGEPQEPGGFAPAFRRTRDHPRAASHDGRGLIAAIEVAGRGLAALTRSPIGIGYAQRVERAIIEIEHAAQARIETAQNGVVVSRTKLDAMIGFEASARKTADELTARLRTLEAAPNPKRSWLHRIGMKASPDVAPNQKAEIAVLRREVIEAERVLRGAISAVARAERDHGQAVAVASEKVESIIRESRKSLNEARVTRNLVSTYPRLAFAGPAFVTWAGGKVYRARQRYNVINPQARDMWGLPLDPGY